MATYNVYYGNHCGICYDFKHECISLCYSHVMMYLSHSFLNDGAKRLFHVRVVEAVWKVENLKKKVGTLCDGYIFQRYAMATYSLFLHK